MNKISKIKNGTYNIVEIDKKQYYRLFGANGDLDREWYKMESNGNLVMINDVEVSGELEEAFKTSRLSKAKDIFSWDKNKSKLDKIIIDVTSYLDTYCGDDDEAKKLIKKLRKEYNNA